MVYYLPNLDDDASAPADWDAFWEQAAFMLELVRCDLEKELQSQEEAIGDALRQLRDDVIRYRKSDDPEQIAYFHNLGRRTLEIVEGLAAAREWTPALAHHWSVLMFAHGFVMPSAFARDNDLDNERRGIRGREATSREPQRRWYAHYLLREFTPLRKRAEADERILRLVSGLVSGGTPLPPGYGREWFEGLLDESQNELSSTLGLIGRPKARNLAKLGLDGLPPVDLPIP